MAYGFATHGRVRANTALETVVMGSQKEVVVVILLGASEKAKSRLNSGWTGSLTDKGGLVLSGTGETVLESE